MKPRTDKMAPSSSYLSILMILCTWNIHGAFSGIAELKQVVMLSDIVFVSEHWLSKNCLSILETSFDNKVTLFAKHGVTTNNTTRGGEAFIVKQSEDYIINQIELSNERILAIKLTIRRSNVYIIGCLLPSTNLSFEVYKDVLLELFDLYDELCENGPVNICGDFNTDIINKRSSLKSKVLVDCVIERNLCNTFESDEVFSYQSKDRKSQTFLDYIFVPEWLKSKIMYKEIYSEFNYNISDHFPVFAEIDFKQAFTQTYFDLSRIIPRWNVANSDNLNSYKNKCDNYLCI